MSEDFDLGSLDDEELVEQMHDDLYDGLADEIAEGTEILLDRSWDAQKVLNEALVEGMRIVGIDFRDGILFVPEVLLAAKAMKAGMEILRPILSASGVESVGKVVIGTVKGDIHDIGKNLVAMMLEGAGFEVINLGINTDAEEFLTALEEHEPDILGMSALLTTTMPYMKVVIDAMKEEGIREEYIVLVGGAPLNEEFGEAVGADAYCRDAAVAAETAKTLVENATRQCLRRGGEMTETVVSSATRELVIGPNRPFTIIGERINPTGRKLLAAEMKRGDYSRVEADALAQVAAGAHMLDVNAGIPLADEPAILAEAVQLVQSLTDVPISIDSSIVEALEAGLGVYQGKALVNSVTGEEEGAGTGVAPGRQARSGGGGHLQRRDRHLRRPRRPVRGGPKDRLPGRRLRDPGQRCGGRPAGHADRGARQCRQAGVPHPGPPERRVGGQLHMRSVERQLRAPQPFGDQLGLPDHGDQRRSHLGYYQPPPRGDPHRGDGRRRDDGQRSGVRSLDPGQPCAGSGGRGKRFPAGRGSSSAGRARRRCPVRLNPG